MPLALIPFLLLVVPVLEIGVFIAVGGAIGLWPTLGLVVLTAVIGSVLLRRQGLSTLEAIQRETRAGRVPGRELVSGLMIAIAGVLLLTPGFVTDTLGFLLFVPFLIIDMVVASVLMSMGMMMLPPIIIALPFKIIFFVLVDGWFMIVGSLVRGFGG